MLHPRPLIHQVHTGDGSGIMRDAQTAKPQKFITGDGWFVYNLAVNPGQLQAQDQALRHRPPPHGKGPEPDPRTHRPGPHPGNPGLKADSSTEAHPERNFSGLSENLTSRAPHSPCVAREGTHARPRPSRNLQLGIHRVEDDHQHWAGDRKP